MLQILSPKNAGLFKRAISQSGVSLCSWAIQKDPLYWAKKVMCGLGPSWHTGQLGTPHTYLGWLDHSHPGQQS